MPEQPAPRLLAGAPWRERLRPPRPTDAPRWFEPIHVREPARVREALAAQVEAGADVVTAPAWLTHRRALMEIGESRRAAEWTHAAVQLAREAVEEALARRTEARGGQAVLVAGPLLDLGARPETGSGRLAERGAAADRDRDGEAGILAEAGVDLIVVEAHSSVEAGTRAAAAAAATGLEVWAAVPAAGADKLDAWSEALTTAGASTILLEVPDASGSSPGATDPFDAGVERAFSRDGRSVGVLLPLGQPDAPGDRLRRWLEVGVAVLAVSEGATPEALKPLREAIDAEISARTTAREASEAPWRALVAEAADWAPSGAALWLDGNPSATLPDGFAWTRASTDELGRLPPGAYRFVVAGGEADLRDLVRLLDEGGIAVARLPADELLRVDDARVIEARQDGSETMIVLRRVR